jgi:DNA-binding transcriptional MerR regulator
MEQVQDLTAGGMAKELDKSVDTVRELERRGIIQSRRDSSNRRLFGRDQLERARAHYAKRA